MRQVPLIILTLITLLFATYSTQAYQVSDLDVSEVVPATAERPELKLNGAALRELYLLIESYVGSLYLEKPSTSAQEILDDNTTHKRMVFHTMIKKVGARRIANALQEALVLNITEEEHQELQDEVGQMLGYFQGKMHRGDETWFDFIPGKGTVVTINGQEQGIIQGDLFFRALLSIWIGENPVGRDFKNEILGLNRVTDTQQVAEGS